MTLVKNMSSIYEEENEINEEIIEENVESTNEPEEVKKKNVKGKKTKNKKLGKVGGEKKRKIKKAIKKHIANLSVDMYAARHKKDKIKARALAHTIKSLRAQAKSL